MTLSRDYRRPFWLGLLHAVAVVLYLVFISLLLLAITPYLVTGSTAGILLQFLFGLFVTVFSIAFCGYLIFFEPMKLIMHHHFRAGSVMVASTLGWLFILLLVFTLGYALTVQL